MSIDLILKPSCSVCGSSQELYGSTCKHLTLCVNCGKGMAEKRAKCYECGSIITRLIRVRFPSFFSPLCLIILYIYIYIVNCCIHCVYCIQNHTEPSFGGEYYTDVPTVNLRQMKRLSICLHLLKIALEVMQEIIIFVIAFLFYLL